MAVTDLPFSNLDSLFSVDSPNVVIDTIKHSESGGTSTIVFRLYESKGGRGTTNLKTAFPIKEAYYSNVLEEKLESISCIDSARSVVLNFTPFTVQTICVVFDL